MFISPPHSSRIWGLLLGLALLALPSCANADPAIVAVNQESDVDDGGASGDVPDAKPDEDPDLLDDILGAFEVPCLVPGAWACECATNAECTSGWCVPSVGVSLCTAACDGECPEDWACRTVPDVDEGPVDLCVPLHVNLCRPCSSDAECETVGDLQPACLERADGGGAFCGAPCNEELLCPTGFVCEIQTAGGGDAEEGQCVPAGGSVCECTDRAIAEGATTLCTIVNEHGSCTGTRTCGPDGLAECEGESANAEACDDVDNDCDGSIDEDLGTVTCGMGACWTKAPVCIAGVSVECVPSAPDPDVVELCDGIDNDCDGPIDEAFEPLSCGVGLCSTSVPACVNGEINTCKPIFQPGEVSEICNGVDDDCDGEIDEDFGGPGCS